MSAKLLFFAGGECLARHGVFTQRTSPTEDVAETFTRSGAVATYVGGGGVVQTSQADIPRAHYIGGAPYLLAEKASTNLCLQSEAFGTTWVTTRSAVVDNQETAPDGATTADFFRESTAADDTHFIEQQVAKAASALDYVFSVYLKADDRDHVEIRLYGISSTDNCRATFDIGTGVIDTAVAAGGDFTVGVAAIEALDDSWYRCSVTCTTNTDTQLNMRLYLHDGSSTSYTGDGASGIHVWGADLELTTALRPTSYIPTTTVAVTRNVDDFRAPYPYPCESVTIYAKIRSGLFATQGYIFTLAGSAGNSLPACGWERDTATDFKFFHLNGVSGSATSTITSTPTADQLMEFRGVINADGSVYGGLSLDGGTETLGATSSAHAFGTVWGPTQGDSWAYVGAYSGALSPWTLECAAVKVARGEQTLTTMRAL